MRVQGYFAENAGVLRPALAGCDLFQQYLKILSESDFGKKFLQNIGIYSVFMLWVLLGGGGVTIYIHISIYTYV